MEKRKISEEDILNILNGAKNKGFIICSYPFNKDISIHKNRDDREEYLSFIWNYSLNDNGRPDRDYLIIQSQGHSGRVVIKKEELSEEFLLKYDLFLKELDPYLENNLIKDINEMFAEEPRKQETINDLNDDDD